MQALTALRTLLNELPQRLEKLPKAKVGVKPDSSNWSAKEELGHLLDSAVNNHQRIVRTQLEENPSMPSYDGERWVELHHYQQRDWNRLVQLWRFLNEQLLASAEAASPSAWTRTCTIGDSGPLTLQFVLDDYLEHMMHHLRHIGIEVDDLISV